MNSASICFAFLGSSVCSLLYSLILSCHAGRWVQARGILAIENHKQGVAVDEVIVSLGRAAPSKPHGPQDN